MLRLRQLLLPLRKENTLMKNALLCAAASLCAHTAMTDQNPVFSEPRCHRHNNDHAVVDDINRPKYRFSRICNNLFTSRQKTRRLERYDWYKTITGGWAHPHAIDRMSRHEIRRLNIEQLEYKLKHGSQAPLPDYLRTKKGN